MFYFTSSQTKHNLNYCIYIKLDKWFNVVEKYIRLYSPQPAVYCASYWPLASKLGALPELIKIVVIFHSGDQEKWDDE